MVVATLWKRGNALTLEAGSTPNQVPASHRMRRAKSTVIATASTLPLHDTQQPGHFIHNLTRQGPQAPFSHR
eukprot:scaffold324106_cov52-Tisochrysis_lutea.AAC.1